MPNCILPSSFVKSPLRLFIIPTVPCTMHENVIRPGSHHVSIEVIDEVADYLEPSDQTPFRLACGYLPDVATMPFDLVSLSRQAFADFCTCRYHITRRFFSTWTPSLIDSHLQRLERILIEEVLKSLALYTKLRS